MESIEERLKKGIPVNLTKENPVCELPEAAEKYNLHIGKPYRIVICGMNPLCQAVYEGTLTFASVILKDKGFFVAQAFGLEDGCMIDMLGNSMPFEREGVQFPPEKLVSIGRFADEEAFQERLKKMKERK